MKGFIEVTLGHKIKDKSLKSLISIDNIDCVLPHKDRKVLHHDKSYVIETNTWIELKREIGFDQKFILVVETYEEIKEKIKQAQGEK